jgi:EmrB/QacA subfamily drug resistance transporter
MAENVVSTQRYKILAALMLGGIMGPIDASIVNVILPTIAHFFNASLATAQWVPLIYLLTISSMLLFYGRLGDIWGYRLIYLIGLGCFVAASLFCGLAPTIYFLIVFRALQGIGAGMMMAVPFAILTAVFEPHERGKAMGINAISISAGLALGPTLGGLLTALWSWRLVFLINLPIGLIALLWGLKVIPDLKGKPGRMDFGGALTAFVSLLSFLFFINHLQVDGWSLLSGSALGIALLAGIAFLYFESHLPDPMVNLDLFKNHTFSLGIISSLLNFASQYTLVFLTPFYLQRVMNYSPEKIGFLMTSFPLAVMLVAPLSGALSDKFGSRRLAVLGSGLCAVALITMAYLPLMATAFVVSWRLALFGLGNGIFQSPNNNAVMGSVPRPYLGVASSVLGTVRNVGMAVGIAFAGLLLYLSVPPEIIAREYLTGSDAFAFLKGLHAAYLFGAFCSLFAAYFSFKQAKGV